MNIERVKKVKESIKLVDMFYGAPFEDQYGNLCIVVDDASLTSSATVKVVYLCDGTLEEWDSSIEVYPVEAKIILDEE